MPRRDAALWEQSSEVPSERRQNAAGMAAILRGDPSSKTASTTRGRSALLEVLGDDVGGVRHAASRLRAVHGEP